MSFVSTFFAAALVILGGFGPAAFAEDSVPRSELTCKVTKVLDGGSFETENGFTFAEHPVVAYRNKGAGQHTLTIGSLVFSTDDTARPTEIEYTDEMNVIIVEAMPKNSDLHYSLVTLADSDTGLFAFDGRAVADLDCPK